MRRMMYFLAAVSCAPVALAAQAPDTVALVITLGQDTIGVERYTRTADRLVDDMVMRDRTPAIVRHLVADLGPDGMISRIEVDNKPVIASDVSPIHIVARFTIYL